MLPLRDDTRSSGVPWATLAVAVACGAAFGAQLLAPSGSAASLLARWALVPTALATAPLASAHTLLTSAFLHASWGHIAANLLFLSVFGPGIEHMLGRRRFLVLLAASAVAAGLAHALSDPTSAIPLIGASGAISGVMGATALLRPRARVRVLVLAAVVPVGVTVVPSIFLLGVWLLTQAAAGLAPVTAQAADPVAWMAHLGGFAGGVAGGALLRGSVSASRSPRSRPRRS